MRTRPCDHGYASLHIPPPDRQTNPSHPRLYEEFAEWWPLLSSPEDYAEEAHFYYRQLAGRRPGPRSLLELGSGGGNNAFHLKERFQTVTLVDISAGMLDVSRRINPECEHIEGDMRSLSLDRSFDCVFIHDAIVYMTTEEDLRAALTTAFRHCMQGGTALFVPDYLRETFHPATGHGGRDADGRGLRYLQWEWDPDPDDSTYTTDFVYLIRNADQELRVEFDRHTCGLFSRERWLTLLKEVGFAPRIVPLEHSDLETGACEVFVCRKP